jgi:hypothetical protein
MTGSACSSSSPHRQLSGTLGIYIDHNLGGLVKDAFLAGLLSGVRRKLSLRDPDAAGMGLRELDLPEARARVEAALYMLDHTWDPPVDKDVRALRALVDARLRLLPDGFELPDDHEEVSAEDREQLLADFLAPPEGERWRGVEDAEDVVTMAIDFGAGYNHGGPLRWSPVVVEIFMTSWPRTQGCPRARFLHARTRGAAGLGELRRPRPWRAGRALVRGCRRGPGVPERDARGRQRPGDLGSGKDVRGRRAGGWCRSRRSGRTQRVHRAVQRGTRGVGIQREQTRGIEGLFPEPGALTLPRETTAGLAPCVAAAPRPGRRFRSAPGRLLFGRADARVSRPLMAR